MNANKPYWNNRGIDASAARNDHHAPMKHKTAAVKKTKNMTKHHAKGVAKKGF